MSDLKNGYVRIEVPPVREVSDGGIIVAGFVPKAVKAKVLDAGECPDVAAGNYISVPSHAVKSINGTFYIHQDNIDGLWNNCNE